jgi:hypothetical protein
MNKLLYLLFPSIFLFDYLSNQVGLLGRYITWFPELLSMLAILIICARFVLVGGKNTPQKVMFFIFLFLLNIVLGAIINQVPAGPLIAGLRKYLKFLPFFILPFVYSFSSQQIHSQLKFILFFIIIQSPITLYQRLVVTGDSTTGDMVRGTLTSSGLLTVTLSCAIAILMTFYLAKKIDFRLFVLLFCLFFLPMTINETKSTLILVPLALLLPMYFSSNGIKLTQLIPIIALGIVAGIAFVFIYDYFMKPRWGYGIMDFLSMEGRTESYLYKGTEADGYVGKIGKMDSYVLAFKTLSHNVINLLFGLGIGNVTESFIPGLSGEYAEAYKIFVPDMTAMSLILWELGMFGVILYYVLYFIVFRDSRRLGVQDGFISTFANGWSVVAILFMISTCYANIFVDNAIGYLFWYFSGYFISESFKHKKANARSFI